MKELSTAFSRYVFSQKNLKHMFDRVLNTALTVSMEKVASCELFHINALCQALSTNVLEFYLLLPGFSFTNIHNSQDSIRGRPSLQYLSTTSTRFTDISRAITAESSLLHVASSLSRTANLWFPSASR